MDGRPLIILSSVFGKELKEKVALTITLYGDQ